MKKQITCQTRGVLLEKMPCPFYLFGKMWLDACFIVFSFHLKSLLCHIMQCDYSCYINNYVLFFFIDE